MNYLLILKPILQSDDNHILHNHDSTATMVQSSAAITPFLGSKNSIAL